MANNPLYKTKEWRRLRAHVLKHEPICRMCKAEGRVSAASHVDHIIRHNNDPKLFYDLTNLQPLCPHCHNSRKQSIESRGYDKTIGIDGLPADPAHPFNR